MTSITCGSQILDISTPKVMGILNVTTDSFFESSRVNLQNVVAIAAEMLEQGASILDVGGQSSRPGATTIGARLEQNLVVPVIQALASNFPNTILSIDTYHASVAQAAVQAGAHIVNDISAGDIDAAMLPTVAGLGVPYIAMHMQGTPNNMQQNPQYEQVTDDIVAYFKIKIDQLQSAGVQQVILDPGFGFGKTLAHNYQLLAQLEQLCALQKPVLVGMSRKSMIYKPLQISPSEALNGTSFLHAFALQNGAKILRVHDVKEAVQCIKLFELLQANV